MKAGVAGIVAWLLLLTAGLSGCAGRYRYDVPRELIQAPGSRTWGVALLKSREGNRVSSTTVLNGNLPLKEKPTATIASGKVEGWKWRVKTTPSLVQSWTAWQAKDKNKKIRREALSSGNQFHTAIDWDLAFERAYRATRYLYGKQPPPLHATLLLLPEGVKYHARITQDGAGYFPVTLAFYWPPSRRLLALEVAVTKTIYEYQHLLVDARLIPRAGGNEGDQTANDEARSQCWNDSVFLALNAGTKTTMQWKISQARAAAALLQRSTQYKINESKDNHNSATPDASRTNVPYTDAYVWGRFFEVESLAAYLRRKGIADLRVVANEPQSMNAVLSVCRAMTQHPLDITTTGGYPASHVQYVPFFPANLSKHN